jgi:hypothetical protein
MQTGEHDRDKELYREGTQRGEHSTDEKERIQRREPRDDEVRERGADTGGGKLRP